MHPLPLVLCAWFLLSACSSNVAPGLPSGSSTTQSGQRLYVADQNARAIYVFSLTAATAPVPVATIQGSATGLKGPSGVAVDNAGDIYVAEYNDVLVFAAGSNGNVAPIKTLASPEPDFSQFTGIAVDAARNIYVADYRLRMIWIYSAGSAVPNGIGTSGQPWGIAVDSAGKVYASLNNDPSAIGSIAEWNAGRTGNVPPDNSITGLSSPTGMSVVGGNIYVTDGLALYAFPTSASGAAAPTRVISGPATTLGSLSPGFRPQGVAADSFGNMYVAYARVPIFAAGSNGNVAPSAILTLPTSSVGVAVH